MSNEVDILKSERIYRASKVQLNSVERTKMLYTHLLRRERGEQKTTLVCIPGEYLEDPVQPLSLRGLLPLHLRLPLTLRTLRYTAQ